MVFLLAVPSWLVAAQTTQSVPAEDKQRDATALILEVYKVEIAAATSPTQKSALAAKLIQVGIKTQNDPAGQFALFKEAQRLSIEAGDYRQALEASKEISQHFEVDALKTKADVVGQCVGTTSDPEGLLTAVYVLVDDAIEADHYDAAKQLAEAAFRAAQVTKNLDVMREAGLQRNEVRELEVEFTKVQKALQVHQTLPNDPDANLVVGQYRCFVKGDWGGC